MGIKTRIRTLHLREKKSLSEIARKLGLWRNTVKKWLNAPQEVEPRYARREATATKIAPYAEWLRGALRVDAHRAKAQRRTAKALFEAIRCQGYPGGYSRVKDFIRARSEDEGLTTTSAFVPLVFELGEAFQFDWSEEGLTVGGVYYRAQVANMKLCASRAFWLVAYGRFTPSPLLRPQAPAYASTEVDMLPQLPRQPTLQ